MKNKLPLILTLVIGITIGIGGTIVFTNRREIFGSYKLSNIIRDIDQKARVVHFKFNGQNLTYKKGDPALIYAGDNSWYVDAIGESGVTDAEHQILSIYNRDEPNTDWQLEVGTSIRNADRSEPVYFKLYKKGVLQEDKYFSL